MSTKVLTKLSLALAICGAAGTPAFAADSTVVVTPTDMKGWAVTDFRGVSNGMGTSNTVAQIDGTYKPSGSENGSIHFTSFATSPEAGPDEARRRPPPAGLCSSSSASA